MYTVAFCLLFSKDMMMMMIMIVRLHMTRRQKDAAVAAVIVDLSLTAKKIA